MSRQSGVYLPLSLSFFLSLLRRRTPLFPSRDLCYQQDTYPERTGWPKSSSLHTFKALMRHCWLAGQAAVKSVLIGQRQGGVVFIVTSNALAWICFIFLSIFILYVCVWVRVRVCGRVCVFVRACVSNAKIMLNWHDIRLVPLFWLLLTCTFRSTFRRPKYDQGLDSIINKHHKQPSKWTLV